MSDAQSTAQATEVAPCLQRVGFVVHPVRDVDEPLRVVRAWADQRAAELVQIPFAGEQRQVFEQRDPGECDLVVALGGDGTTLAAVRSAARAQRPVLGVACGSLGALTSVGAEDIGRALDRYGDGHWSPWKLPALKVSAEDRDEFLAFNDVVVIRQGSGQVRVSVTVDGELYGRMAGDGCVVSTPVGSSAYTVAAGGPLIHADVDAFVVTGLPTHGGFCPPLVVGPRAELRLELSTGHGGGRLEVDGQGHGEPPERLCIDLAPEAATLITFPGEERFITGLRRRGIIADSPRILAEDERD